MQSQPKLWRRQRARIVPCALGGALVMVGVGSLVLTACGGDDDCDLEARSRALGGAGLMDCGFAAAGNTSTVDRCAVTAFQGRSTFRALYESEDGGVEALVHAAGDSYFLLRETDQGIERIDCASARVATDGARSYVECVSPADPVLDCS